MDTDILRYADLRLKKPVTQPGSVEEENNIIYKQYSKIELG